MAKRPIFVATPNGTSPVRTFHVEFQWFSGMAISQAQKSIRSLHDAAKQTLKVPDVLEISSKSPRAEGVALSAFNLTFESKKGQLITVECAYQGSKVFERGGPFPDLYQASSREAKKDPRLFQHGRLTKFSMGGRDWGLEPRTAFYDWLYINALHRNPALAELVCTFEAFSDIAFNPERSLNCQAYAAALYASLSHRGALEQALEDRTCFLEIVKSMDVSNAHEDTVLQKSMLSS